MPPTSSSLSASSLSSLLYQALGGGQLVNTKHNTSQLETLKALNKRRLQSQHSTDTCLASAQQQLRWSIFTQGCQGQNTRAVSSSTQSDSSSIRPTFVSFISLVRHLCGDDVNDDDLHSTAATLYTALTKSSTQQQHSAKGKEQIEFYLGSITEAEYQQLITLVSDLKAWQQQATQDKDGSQTASVNGQAQRKDWNAIIAGYHDPLRRKRRAADNEVKQQDPYDDDDDDDDDDDGRWSAIEQTTETEARVSDDLKLKGPNSSLAGAGIKLGDTRSSTKPSVMLSTDTNSLRSSWSWLLYRSSAYVTYTDTGQPVMSALELASTCVKLHQSTSSDSLLQSELLDLLGVEAFDFVAEMLQQRQRLRQIKPSQMIDLIDHSDTVDPTASSYPHTHAAAPPQLLGVSINSLRDKELSRARRRDDRRMARHSAKDTSAEALNKQKETELEKLEEQANSLNEWRSATSANTIHATSLPTGSKRTQHKGYEEVYIPPSIPSPVNPDDLVSISALDPFAQPAFPDTKYLNRIQSKCFDAAYKHNNNLLICAPTGAGVLQKDLFKIVYVAPMKALAQEIQATFQRRLAPLGIVVKELTGDMQLTKQEIQETQLIITTPEKWDVLTRKNGDGSFHSLVRLLIIDEVHLLHEDRGPVIEILVARTLRLVETSQEMCRIVGLSATLPNYRDVAIFCAVDVNTGLFYFDQSHRPVPLTQYYLGVTESNAMKRIALMNELCYKKVIASVRAGHQVMVFVHSRRDTVKTARALRELAHQYGEMDLLNCTEHAQWGLSEKKMHQTHNSELIELFMSGFAVHHAGMVRSDRALVERFFAHGLISVLVCTATLAWGVNLPAHTVVIKGTQIYDAHRGGYVDIGMLDVMQIFGRAGRPQFDKSGEGIIITESAKLQKYLSLLTHALPIESQFIQALPDHLNAEIILGTVTTMKEAITWLGYTYLYIRMLRNPMIYGIDYAALELDPHLVIKRRELLLEAAQTLMRCKMVRFDVKSGQFYPTDIGRVASHYYIHHESVEQYNARMTSRMSDEEIFDLIAASKEFTALKVRDDEMGDMEKLAHKYCPIKIKGGVESTVGKANLLLQTYISSGLIDHPTLISDSYFITQSAGRISRALFEMVLKRGKTYLALRFLTLAKMIERRIWEFQHPLRQFQPYLKMDTLMRLEEKNVSVDDLLDMEAEEIGALIRHSKVGYDVARALSYLPYLELSATVQPITRSVLRVSLTVTPAFVWMDRWHGSVESFWIWVEDAENEHIYHTEYLLIHKKQQQQTQNLSFTIPIFEPLPPQYFIKGVSDRWLGSESTFAVSFKHLILPELHPPHTQLLDLHPLAKSCLYDPPAEAMYKFTHFNPIQTQVFHACYHTDTNILLGAPTGSGKTVVAELCMLRLWRLTPHLKCVYIAPLKALARERIEDWNRDKSLKGMLGKVVMELTGDTAPSLQLLQQADVLITTPEKWDGITRHWQSRSYVQQVGLIIIDEIHLLGGDRGPVLEVIVSRMRYISNHTERNTRVVGLSTALANARDLADWLGIEQNGLFNFPPSVRPVPLSIHIAGFPGKHYCPRMATMNKPTYAAIMTHSPNKPVLVFVSSRRQTRLTALDLIAFSAGDGNPRKFLHMTEAELVTVSASLVDPHLRHMLAFGIGMHHAGLAPGDRMLVEQLYAEMKIQVLICTSTLAWGVNFPAHLVVIKGTEFYDTKTKRYVDFPITDVLQMMGRAGRPQFDTQGIAVVLVHEPKKNYYLNFLHSPFPVESSLLNHLHNHLNAEVQAGTIKSISDALDYLSWTFLFRRLLLNPSYYGLTDITAQGLNHFLTQITTQCFQELEQAGLIQMTETRLLQTMPMGRIASFYYLDYRTIVVFNKQLHAAADLCAILSALSNSVEYAELPVRHNENVMNEMLAKQSRWSVPDNSFESPHTKAHLLFQCLFSRSSLPVTDYATDTKSLLDQSQRILQAMVDVCAERGWLHTSLLVMLMMQMLIQARWMDDSSIRNVPHCDHEQVLAVFWDAGCESLAQLCHMHDDKRAELALSAGMTLRQYDETRNYLNRMPIITCDIQFAQSVEEQLVRVNVRLLRSSLDANSRIISPVFNKPKDEGWFCCLGREDTDELVLIKRVNGLTNSKPTTFTLTFPMPLQGHYNYTLFIISDSYLGLDQQYSIQIQSDLTGQPAGTESVTSDDSKLFKTSFRSDIEYDEHDTGE